ncbi:MAG: aldo/keto reductase [Bifidobacteriaceae bacterium]|jgi:aryl-alcohol dehydrogenase-like predicted oxidoreductase|nr:aldo/keto reductase [Bifidobacteriaceae bacterium]
MQTRKIGDFASSAIGLGEMPMSIEGRPDREQAIRTIHAALDAGVRHIDTAYAYRIAGESEAHGELLLGEALRTWGGDRGTVLLATKAGHLRNTPGSVWQQDGRPEHIKAVAKASAKNLGVEAVGLFYYHRPDPAVPFADSVGALAELLDEGVIVRAGVSNVNPAQIRQAQESLGGRLAAVQNQFSPAFRSSEPELELCTRLGIAFLPWSPLGGIGGAKAVGAKFAAFHDVAAAHGVSAQQVVLAWELAKSARVIPIPGASRPESILDSIKAADLVLTPEELSAVD